MAASHNYCGSLTMLSLVALALFIGIMLAGAPVADQLLRYGYLICPWRLSRSE